MGLNVFTLTDPSSIRVSLPSSSTFMPTPFFLWEDLSHLPGCDRKLVTSLMEKLNMNRPSPSGHLFRVCLPTEWSARPQCSSLHLSFLASLPLWERPRGWKESAVARSCLSLVLESDLELGSLLCLHIYASSSIPHLFVIMLIF